jgi:hypothetical protein
MADVIHFESEVCDVANMALVFDRLFEDFEGEILNINNRREISAVGRAGARVCGGRRRWSGRTEPERIGPPVRVGGRAGRLFLTADGYYQHNRGTLHPGSPRE